MRSLSEDHQNPDPVILLFPLPSTATIKRAPTTCIAGHATYLQGTGNGPANRALFTGSAFNLHKVYPGRHFE